MKIIKFNDHAYNLVGDVVRESSRIRVVIDREGYDLGQVAPAVSGVETIKVLTDGTVTAIYTGYTLPITLNIYDDYPVYGGYKKEVISIELENIDIQSQIAAITNKLDTQGTEISDIEEAVDSLTDSQATQDLAIEDLAEAVSDITPEEE